MTFAPPQKDKDKKQATDQEPVPAQTVPARGISLVGVTAASTRPPFRLSLPPAEVVEFAVRAFEVAWGRDPTFSVQGALTVLDRTPHKEAVSQLYQKRTGRPLLHDLLRALRGQPVELRDRLSRAYDFPLSATLGFDAFEE